MLEESGLEKSKLKGPQSTVKYLKNKLGDEVGNIYGILSAEAHLCLKKIGKYIMPTEKNILVKEYDKEECKEEMITFAVLLTMYGMIVWEGINTVELLENKKGEYKKRYTNHSLITTDMVLVMEGKINIETIRDTYVI